MKKIAICLIGLVTLAWGCNIDTPDFPDFLYTAVYFPIQYPVRTLSLGEDKIDNSLDRELKFNIGVSIGGLRENTRSWNVNFMEDPSLVENIRQSTGDTLMLMPTEYFSLSSSSLTIPAGEFDGLVQVQLSESFLSDSFAWGQGGLYVIPLMITDSDADSVLRGSALFDDSDPRDAADWDTPPKDFTLFAVKYINEYHGMYLHRGVDVVSDSNGNVVETRVFREEFVVQDQLWKLSTIGRNVIETSGVGMLTTDGDDINGMRMVISGNNVEITDLPNNGVSILAGSGSYVPDGDHWGGESRDAFHLTYTFEDSDKMLHAVTDTLVFRDRDIVFETYLPEVVE